MHSRLEQTRAPLVAVLLLAAVTAMLFSIGALGDFVYDDEYLIVANPEVQHLQHLRRSLLRPFWDLSGSAGDRPDSGDYYRPLITLAYTLQYRLFGRDPLGYHLINLALHVLASVLALLLLSRRLGDAREPNVTLAAALGAAVFAWHPTRVESVSWISGCTDLFMGLFVLLGLLCWQRLRGRLSIALTTLCLTLAFLSKEAAVLVPVWLVLDTRLQADAAERPARTRAALLVCAALAVVIAARLWLVPLGSSKLTAIAPQLVARVSSTFGHYAAAIAWPWPGTVLRAPQRFTADGWIAYAPWSIALGVAVALAVLALAWQARRRPGLRPALSEVLFVLATLAPVLQLIPLGVRPQIAERFLYLPMFGVAALCARALHALMHRHGQGARAIALVVAGPVLAAMAAGVVEHSQHFASTQALWEHEVRVHSTETLPALMLADLRVQQRRFDEGLALALRAHRDAVAQRDAAAQLGLALLAARAFGERTPHGERGALQALAAFYDDLVAGKRAQLQVRGARVALAVGKAQLPTVRGDVRDVVVPRAFVYARLRRFDDAIAVLEAARKQAPNDLDVQRALALIYAQAGRFAPAHDTLRRAAALSPDDPSIPALRMRIDQAQALLAREAPHPVARALTDAQGYLLLSAPDMAADALERGLMQARDSPQLLAMLAQIDAIEGRFGAARGRIESARLLQPHAEPLWQATLRDIEQQQALRSQR